MREIMFLLLFLLPLSIALLFVLLSRKNGATLRVKAGIIAFLITFVIWMGVTPMTRSGVYWRIGCIIAFSIGIYTSVWLGHRVWLRLLLMMCIALAGITAAFMLSRIDGGYRGDNVNNCHVYRADAAEYVKETLLRFEGDSIYSAGYITKGSPIIAALPASKQNVIEIVVEESGYDCRILTRWHTPFTGLYRVDTSPMRLWYPGGKIKDNIDNIEWRDYAIRQ